MRYEFTKIFPDYEHGIYTIHINYSGYIEKYMIFDMNHKNIFKTDSKEELKIWLDLYGLKFKKVIIKYKKDIFLARCIIYCERG